MKSTFPQYHFHYEKYPTLRRSLLWKRDNHNDGEHKSSIFENLEFEASLS